MIATLCWLFILLFLAGCSSGIGSSVMHLTRCGKMDIGNRLEIRVDFDEPMDSDKEPCPDRREIYDQGGKSNSIFDQTFSVMGALKF
jgi:hypothetical protein